MGRNKICLVKVGTFWALGLITGLLLLLVFKNHICSGLTLVPDVYVWMNLTYWTRSKD